MIKTELNVGNIVSYRDKLCIVRKISAASEDVSLTDEDNNLICAPVADLRGVRVSVHILRRLDIDVNMTNQGTAVMAYTARLDDCHLSYHISDYTLYCSQMNSINNIVSYKAPFLHQIQNVLRLFNHEITLKTK